MALTDSTGTIVQHYEYDSFGNRKDMQNTIKQPYAYTGREHDRETGLYYYRARYYDAMEGRFISKDPIGFAGGDVNLYRYVGGNPVNYVDPSGRSGLIGLGIGATSGLISGTFTGYANGGVEGAVKGAIIGTLSGGLVGIIMPTASSGAAASITMAALTGGISNFAGQVLANKWTGEDAFHNYSIGSTVGATLAGAATGTVISLTSGGFYGPAGQVLTEGGLDGFYSGMMSLAGDTLDGGSVPFVNSDTQCH